MDLPVASQELREQGERRQGSHGSTETLSRYYCIGVGSGDCCVGEGQHLVHLGAAL